ncbi:MAG: DUF308 domain-containing protein [Psychromonas sp.]|nr:DUF308 domain-containing protein [Psychromonas sp.]
MNTQIENYVPVTNNNIITKSAIRKTTAIGILMMLIGLLGMLVPWILSLTINMLIGGMFILGSVSLSMVAWDAQKQTLWLWFKPLLLLLLGSLVLFYPGVMIASLGLLVAIYFIFSGFNSFLIAFEHKKTAKWLMLFNSLLSVILGVLVLANWPFNSVAIVGLVIGISYWFDGIGLIVISRQLKKDLKRNKQVGF